MSFSLEKCLRCKNKEAVFICVNCESFNFLCTQCDNYVHGLPSKKKHRRNVLMPGSQDVNKDGYHHEENYKKEGINSLSEANKNLSNKPQYVNCSRDFTAESRNNFKPYVNLSNIQLKFENRENQKMDASVCFNYPRQVNDNLETQTNSSIEQNAYRNFIKNSQSHSSNNFQDFEKINNRQFNPLPTPIEEPSNAPYLSAISPKSEIKIKDLNLQTYSRDYLNEMKSIFEKEKIEIIFKNSSLQSNLERLKKNFSDQIYHLNFEIEDIQKKHSNHLQSIQENSENRIQTILIEKDSCIEQLKNQIYELEDINKQLRKKNEEYSEEIMRWKNIRAEESTNFKKQLLISNEGLIKIKNEYEIQISKMENFFEEEKKKLIFDYELKIEKMVNQFQDMQNNMKKIKEDTDNNIKSLVEQHKIKMLELENENETQKKEIECHKQNILAIRNKKNSNQEEIQRLNDSLDLLKKDNKFYVAELRILEQHNNQLIRENENFKIQVSKLDKLVYGKIRMPPYKN